MRKDTARNIVGKHFFDIFESIAFDKCLQIGAFSSAE